MGLGKTLSIISLIAQDVGSPDPDSKSRNTTLLVVPSSLVRTWDEELRRHTAANTLHWKIYHGPNRHRDLADLLNCDIVITTYNVLATEWRGFATKQNHLFVPQWHRIVLDEGMVWTSLSFKAEKRLVTGHEIRTSATVRAQAVYALRGKCRWVVTGTPIQNRWEDLTSILKFLGLYPDQDFKSVTSIMRAGLRDRSFQNILLSLCLRRPKAALQLPSRNDFIHRLDFDESESAEYSRIKDAVVQHIHLAQVSRREGQFQNVLSKINTLRLFCNHGMTSSIKVGDLDDPTNPETKAQKLFDIMISAGFTRCVKCSDDWSTQLIQADRYACQDSALSPRVTSCGLLLCGACCIALEGMGNIEKNFCQHAEPCNFIAVTPKFALGEVDERPTCGLPVKFRALKADITKIPGGEKRYFQFPS